MNETEINQIIELRQQGFGYRRIAVITSIPMNTVKSFCYRHPIAIKSRINICQQCGKRIEQTPHKKAKKFCSDKCRFDWWNTHPENINRKAFYSFRCKFCGREFMSYGNSKRKFCSRNCYNQYRKRGLL